MKSRTSQRTGYFTESVIREMTRLSLLHGGVNLAQGFPDFPAPEALKEAAIRAIRDDINQYAITWGAKRLREAVAVALDMDQTYYDDLAGAYTRRRDFIVDALDAAGFQPFLPKGAYYVMTDISRFRASDDVAFSRRLVRELGVAAVPGSSFYRTEGGGRQKIRFCFCKRDETLREAAVRLQKLSGRRTWA